MKLSKLQHRVTRTCVRVASCWSLAGYYGPSGSGESWFEPRRGNWKAQRYFGGVGPFVFSSLASVSSPGRISMADMGAGPGSAVVRCGDYVAQEQATGDDRDPQRDRRRQLDGGAVSAHNRAQRATQLFLIAALTESRWGPPVICRALGGSGAGSRAMCDLAGRGPRPRTRRHSARRRERGSHRSPPPREPACRSPAQGGT